VFSERVSIIEGGGVLTRVKNGDNEQSPPSPPKDGNMGLLNKALPLYFVAQDEHMEFLNRRSRHSPFTITPSSPSQKSPHSSQLFANEVHIFIMAIVSPHLSSPGVVGSNPLVGIVTILGALRKAVV